MKRPWWTAIQFEARLSFMHRAIELYVGEQDYGNAWGIYVQVWNWYGAWQTTAHRRQDDKPHWTWGLSGPYRSKPGRPSSFRLLRAMLAETICRWWSVHRVWSNHEAIAHGAVIGTRISEGHGLTEITPERAPNV